jgi:hypothetical protein
VPLRFEVVALLTNGVGLGDAILWGVVLTVDVISVVVVVLELPLEFDLAITGAQFAPGPQQVVIVAVTVHPAAKLALIQ